MTSDFDKTVAARIQQQIEEQIAGRPPWLVPGAWVSFADKMAGPPPTRWERIRSRIRWKVWDYGDRIKLAIDVLRGRHDCN